MDLLKEIASKIPEMDPKVMSIMEGETDNHLEIGCKINFKGLSTDCIEKIKLIAKNHSLAILDSEIEFSIYAPSKEGIIDVAKIR